MKISKSKCWKIKRGKQDRVVSNSISFEGIVRCSGVVLNFLKITGDILTF